MYDLSPRVPKVIIQVHAESSYVRGRKLPPLLNKIPRERVRRTHALFLGTGSLALGKHPCPLPRALRGAADHRAHPPQWTQVWPILNSMFPATETQMLRERDFLLAGMPEQGSNPRVPSRRLRRAQREWRGGPAVGGKPEGARGARGGGGARKSELGGGRGEISFISPRRAVIEAS